METSINNPAAQAAKVPTGGLQIIKKYFIKTWGCQMNVYDSLRIGEILQNLGYLKAAALEEADLIILNTCHIREKATEKLFSEVGRIKALKARRAQIGRQLIVGVSGCVAQAEGEEILKRAPYIDLVFGPQTWHRLPFMLQEVASAQKVCDIDFPVEEKFDFLPAFFDTSKIMGGSAFLAIQEGCDKFCTYCVVPYTRGAEYSRPVHKVLLEASRIVAEGAKEIILLGQNVSSYHGLDAKGKERSLAYLIEKLAAIDQLKRIRYITSHPREVSADLIEAHRNIKKLMPFLHLPIQSGSDAVLKHMNRRHSAEDYRRVIGQLKAAVPNLEISSDFIVGYPGETDEDFKHTMALVKEIGFVQSYSFIYSKRPGTPAAKMPDDVPKEVKEERLYELQALLNANQAKFNESCKGRVMPVLLNKISNRGQLNGKTEYMQQVQITTEADASMLGKIVDLEISEANVNVLKSSLPPNLYE